MFIINTLYCMVNQLMLHTSFKGRRERQKGRMYDSQLEEDNREEVEAREDQNVSMAAKMEKLMVKNVLNGNLANMVLNLIKLITT